MRRKGTIIRVVNRELKLKAEIDDYTSSIFTRRFYEPGDFELHIDAKKVGVEHLQKGNLIVLNNNPNKIGIIDTVERNYDEDGVESIAVYGETLKSIIGSRVVVPPVDEAYERIIGNQEEIIKQFVYKNVVNPVNKNRAIKGITIGEQKGLGEQDAWRANQSNNLQDLVTTICRHSQLGWEIYADFHSRELVFDVMKGADRTIKFDRLNRLLRMTDGDTESFNGMLRKAGQVVFSLELENIIEKDFFTSSKDSRNVVYAASKGDVEDRMVLQEGEATGWDRKETFIETNEEEVDIIKNRARQELEALREVNNFSVSIDPVRPFEYEKDYYLGDYLTILDEDWGVVGDYQLIEVTEISEAAGERVEVVLGDPIRTILDDVEELKRMNKGRW